MTCPSFAAPRRRRRPQFGLRALLIATGFLCTALAANANRLHRERKAIERLTAQGAHVEIASNAPQWLPDWMESQFFERAIAVTQRTDGLDLGYTEMWHPLSNIEIFIIVSEFMFWGKTCALTDQSLADIAALHDCALVRLNKAPITPRGLRHLRGLSELRILDLSQTAIDDDALKHLARLYNLQYLDLAATQITDAGLDQLCDLKNLAYVGVGGTCVTDDGVEKLKRALPDCQIGRQWPRRYNR